MFILEKAHVATVTGEAFGSPIYELAMLLQGKT